MQLSKHCYLLSNLTANFYYLKLTGLCGRNERNVGHCHIKQIPILHYVYNVH